jgi:phosphopantothenoylcysteine synthetase/decarboxylase
MMKILVTAGPTREAIDPVRFLSNRSSGRMGYAIAQAAAEAGHECLLISGPVSLSTPIGVERKNVVSADDMFEAVESAIQHYDAAVFSAAVADYKPVKVAPQKIKKEEGQLLLQFERTRDILGSVRTHMAYRGLLIGFAAETENLVTHATTKLKRKGCDLLVANDVSRSTIGFDSIDNEVTFLFAHGEVRELPRASKLELAREIIRAIESLQTHAAASM